MKNGVFVGRGLVNNLRTDRRPGVGSKLPAKRGTQNRDICWFLMILPTFTYLLAVFSCSNPLKNRQKSIIKLLINAQSVICQPKFPYLLVSVLPQVDYFSYFFFFSASATNPISVLHHPLFLLLALLPSLAAAFIASLPDIVLGLVFPLLNHRSFPLIVPFYQSQLSPTCSPSRYRE